MTTQIVTGKLCTMGPKGYLEVPLSTSVTDGTQTEVLSNSDYTVTSQSVGIYAERQKLVGGFVSAKTGIIYAAIINNGIVRSVLPLSSRTSGASGSGDMMVMNQIVLNPGDQLLVETYA
tara:strand:+ start:842 stop:1198 length:357 start_codon:yes stop_codon:yes gene_type:complete